MDGYDGWVLESRYGLGDRARFRDAVCIKHSYDFSLGLSESEVECARFAVGFLSVEEPDPVRSGFGEFLADLLGLIRRPVLYNDYLKSALRIIDCFQSS